MTLSLALIAMLLPAVVSAQADQYVDPYRYLRVKRSEWTLSKTKDGPGSKVEIEQEHKPVAHEEFLESITFVIDEVYKYSGTWRGDRLDVVWQPDDNEILPDVERGCSDRAVAIHGHVALAFRIRMVRDAGGRTFTGTLSKPVVHCGGEVRLERRTEEVFLRPGSAGLVPCPDLSNSVALGRSEFSLKVGLSKTLKALHPANDKNDRDGLCHYAAVGVAAAALRAGGFAGASREMQIAPEIRHLDVSIYRRPWATADPDAVREVRLSWTDSEADAVVLDVERWGVKFKLYSVDITFAPTDAGELRIKDGAIAVQMITDGEVHLGGPVYLSGDLSALLVYNWNEDAPSWSAGTWDLNGGGNLGLEVRHGGAAPIARMNVTFDSATGVAAGRLELTSATSLDARGFAMDLQRSSLDGWLNIRDDTWGIAGGQLEGRLRAKQPIAGDIRFALAWSGDSFQMAIDSQSPMTAFGVTCQNLAFRADLNRETLEFREISGALELKHRDFDASLKIASFLVRDGELVTFLGSGRVAYRNFLLDVSRVAYDARVRPAELALDAAMELGWSSAGGATMDVSNLRIDEAGDISSFGIGATLNSAPVELTFAATFDKSRSMFAGRFSGKFAGTASLAGTVLVGAIPPPDPFSYGYLTLEFNFSRGVPIGQSGLVLVGLNGALGFNYLPAGAPGATGPDGQPRNGTYYLLGGLTIGDVAGLAFLRGELALVLGETMGVGIAGTVQVTRGNPYFVGRVTANYVLGSGAVSGDVAAAVRVPSSGSVVSIDNNVLSYRVGSGAWSVRGVGLGGSFFSFMDVRRGDLRLSGKLTNPVASMTGRLSASLSGNTRATWSYPQSYKPWGNGSGRQCSTVNTGRLKLDCSCSGDSDDSLGFGFAGGFAAGLTGDVDVTLDSTGAPGKVNLAAHLSGSVALTTPASGWFGTSCAQVESVTAFGRIDGTNSNGYLDVNGTLAVQTASGYAVDLPFSYRF